MPRPLPLLAILLLSAPSSAQTCSRWRERTVTGPTPRGEFGFAFDTARSRAVLIGGANSFAFSTVFREVWEWDSSAWTLQSTSGPSGRCDNAVAYDSVRGVTVSFGGYTGVYLADTWEWNGTAWVQRTPATGPAARADSFMVFDSARNVMVLFGGQSPGNIIQGDTWEWNGTAGTWTQRTPAASPPPRWIHRMAYDAARSRTVLFGGAAPSGVLSDGWEFDGTTWTQIPSGPGARYGHTMCYDSDRHITLVFGGQSGFNYGVGLLGDTWEFDGLGWVSRGASGPAPRTFAKMVYDSARKRAVVFGGYAAGGFRADTWEFGAAYANCDGSTGAPFLSVADFACFLEKFAAQDPYANCDQSTADPLLSANDFMCFLNNFAAGCNP